MFGVDALDGHHRHQDVLLLDQARIAGKQRFDKERLIGDHHVINPRTRNIDAGQVALVVHQLVDTGYHDAVAEGGGLHQRRGVFGARSGIEITPAVGLIAGDQRHVRAEIDIQAGVEFDIGVDGADLQLAVLQQLRNAQALRAGEGEVQLTGDALLEDIGARCARRSA